MEFKWNPQRTLQPPQRIFNSLVSRRFEPPPTKVRELAKNTSTSGTRSLLIRQVLALIGMVNMAKVYGGFDFQLWLAKLKNLNTNFLAME